MSSSNAIHTLPLRMAHQLVLMEDETEVSEPEHKNLRSDDRRFLVPADDPTDFVPVERSHSIMNEQRPLPGYRISRQKLTCLYEFCAPIRGIQAMRAEVPRLRDNHIIVTTLNLEQLLNSYSPFSNKDLHAILTAHKVHSEKNDTRPVLLHRLLEHSCGNMCGSNQFYYIFKCRINKRRYKKTPLLDREALAKLRAIKEATKLQTRSAWIERRRIDSKTSAEESRRRVEANYASVPTDELKMEITKEWLAHMNTARFARHVCASCGERELPSSKPFQWEDAENIDFSLLQNEALFVAYPGLTPVDYNFAEYNRALLSSKGLSDTEKKGPVMLCHQCRTDLADNRMPDLAMANWLYYARERLPADVAAAFKYSSTFEKMLVSRCHASKIVHRFSDNPDSEEYGRAGIQSQRYNKGNTMVVPLDTYSVNNCLPPGPEVVRDTMCALFVGKEQPTNENIKKLGPILIRKSRVKLMIEFLTRWNERYLPDDRFTGLSTTNLDRLFPAHSNDDESLPADIDHQHIESNAAVESATSQAYTDRDEGSPSTESDESSSSTEVLMENVGYTDGDATSMNYQNMRMKAIQHCLDGGRFLKSQRGSNPLPDFYEPALLTWLYPHLDPYGIGGFFDPRRPTKLSLERQLRHLLLLDDSPFEKDPTFAFVFYNIIQKRNVVKSANFRVKEGEHLDILNSLLQMKPEELESMAHKFENNPRARPETPQERKIMRTIERLQLVCKDVPGSAAYKQCRRNEIRALINRHGCPAFFVTINPLDIENPLVKLLAGQEVSLEDATKGEKLPWFQERIFVAKNPGAAAIAFDTVIRAFLEKILRHGQNKDGILGRTKAYYGMVEAQGKGTLHCHLLIWLEGHLSPQALRDKMASDEGYKTQIFRWLESLIKCELPSTKQVVTEPDGKALPRPPRSSDAAHPVSMPCPAPSENETWADFSTRYNEFVEDVVKSLNWHKHSHTCWKYLKKGDKQDDAHCRMRIDGSTIPETYLDPETLSIILRRLHPRISRYNDLISFLLKCNNDIQFIGSGEAAKALIYYVTNYITKENLPVHVGVAALAYAIKQSSAAYANEDRTPKRAKNLVTKAINAILSKREISHQQEMSVLIGGGDYYTSHQFSILHWATFDQLISKCFSESGSVTSQVAPEDPEADEEAYLQRDTMHVSFDEAPSETISTDFGFRNHQSSVSVSASNQKCDYLMRSAETEFESLCLYDFVASTVKITKSGEAKRLEKESHRSGYARGDFIGEHGQRATHMLRHKSVQSVPVILGPSIPKLGASSTQDALHHRALLALFKPWRVPSDLKREDQSWSDAFHEYYPSVNQEHRQIMRNIQVLHEYPEEFYHTEGPFDDVTVNSSSGDPAHEVIRILQAADSVIQPSVTVTNGADDDASLELITDNNLGAIRDHTKLMVQLKRKRRPLDLEDAEGARPMNRRRLENIVVEPAASLAVLHMTSNDSESQMTPAPQSMDGIDSDLDVVEEIIRDEGMGDNLEQASAMRIIGNHVTRNSAEQLLMYVSGVGGTGKSHVINSVVKLFERLGRRKELLLSAPTGIAAVLIKGYTIHALTFLPKSNFKTINIEELQQIWHSVKYLIIDEVSMVSASLLAQICNRLSIGKGADASSPEVVFGGVNMLFFGDHGQLKPVRQKAKFSNELVDKIRTKTVQSVRGQEEMYGAYLWRQVKTVIELKKNMRQQGDREYAELLNRVRVGQARKRGNGVTVTGKSDYHTLLSRDLLTLKRNDPDSIQVFKDAPVIVGRKSLRDAINRKRAQDFARATNRTVHDYCSRDRHSMVDFEGEDQRRVWNISSSKTRDFLGKIPLVIGMKVMLIENVAIGNKVVNGADGTLTGLKYETDEDGNRYACVAYVHIPGSNVRAPGLDPDIVPILPVRNPFKWRASSDAPEYNISRLQLPLLPAYSYTDYKSQGRSLDYAIVDLASAHSLQGAYVMLSRVRSLKGLAILRKFDAEKIEQNLSEEIREELGRMEELVAMTLSELAELV